jgi:iron complex transport system substrate-binding protein
MFLKNIPGTLRSFIMYALATIFIVGWWSTAQLWQTQPQHTRPISSVAFTTETDNYLQIKDLSPLERKPFLAALNGDWQQATQMLIAWDSDAQRLIDAGITNIQRLPPSQLLQACRLSYELNNNHLQANQEHALRLGIQTIKDELGRIFTLSFFHKRFLPQSYAAASLLIALTGTDSLVALPSGFRKQQALFPSIDLDSVASDSNRYHAELLQLNPPDIAFTATFSDPNFLSALNDQNIATFILGFPSQLAAIGTTIRNIGTVANAAAAAEVLATYYEGALLAIDNRLTYLRTHDKLPVRPLLLFCYNGKLYLPPSSSLNTEIVNRLTLKNTDITTPSSSLWQQALTHEQLLNYNPDHLVIAAHADEDPLQLFSIPPLSHLPVYQHKGIIVVDSDTQQSIDQHSALAFLDLYQTLHP